MKHPMELEDLSLLVRALHRDVSELDDRLRRVEEIVHELRGLTSPARESLDLRIVESPSVS